MPGVRETGFEIKTFDEIKTELEANFQQVFGSGINLDSTSLLGQQIGIFSKNLYDLWQAASDVYQSRYPATAQGRPLDQIVSFAGIRRKAAFRTSGQVYLLGTPGSVVPQGTILETNEGAEVETSQEATLTAGVAPVMTLSKLPGVTSRTFSINVDRIFPGVHGENLAGQSAVLNFADTPAEMKEKIDNLFQGEGSVTVAKNADGSVITVTFEAPFFLPIMSFQSVTQAVTRIGRADGIDVSAVAVEDGPVVIPASSLVRISTPVSGLLHVTNFLDFVTGRFAEIDSSLRTRWTNRIEGAQTSSAAALSSALQNLSGVSNVLVFEPEAGTADVVVEGGSGADIARTILNTKPLGTKFIGSETETVADENGNPKIIRFSRPENRQISFAISLTGDADFPEDGENQIRAAINEYQNRLPIGGVIRVSPDIVWALNGIRGMNNLSIFINGAASDIQLETRQRAVFQPITVSVSDQQ